ncbi:diguanylate cyclase [Persephonella sp.]
MNIKNIINPVVVIDENFNIVDANEKAEETYGHIKGKKCYQAFNSYSRPCYEETQYICPIKILKDADINRYTGVYSFAVQPGKYVFITVEKNENFFIQSHNIVDRSGLNFVDFRKILNFLSEGLVLIDRKTDKVRFINQRFLNIFGINSKEEEIVNRETEHLDSLLPEEIKGVFSKADKISDEQEFVIHFGDKYLVIKKTTIDDRYILWSFEEKKETDLSDEIFRVLLEMAPVGIFLQCDGKLMYVNPTLASIVETVPGELIGTGIFNFIHPDDIEKVKSIVEKRKKGENFRKKYIIRIITKKGNTRWVEITSDTIRFRGKTCSIGSGIDITEMKELENNLRNLATIDQLTGIYNRYAFEKFLEEESHRAQRYGSEFALIMFDIDNFKQVNDHYGHQTGDRVLKELVQVVKSVIRNSDIFARWGGEEFMILLPIKNKEDALKVAEKVRKTVEKHRFKDVGHLTVSLGVSFFRKDDTIKSLIRRADTALYTAKKEGKNRTITAD